MLNRRRTTRMLSAAIAALVVAGCTDAHDARAPLLPVGPATSHGASGHGSLTRMEGDIPVFALERVIGAEGGALGIEGYALIVPRGAVGGPTTFTFRSVNNGYLEFALTATSAGSPVPNDVGSAGFKVPVVLSVGYERGGGMREWLRLVVAWVRPDGELEPVPTFVNPVGRTVNGRLGHFSQYVVAGGN